MSATADWHSPQGLIFPVRILESRKAYGRIEYQVTPIHGQGVAWVQSGYIKHTNPDPRRPRKINPNITLQPKSDFKK